ncbi:MAG: type II restriction endonuclease [Planctomycetota bacterium]
MRLADFFSGAAAKRIRPVEADPDTSNQHEFNGINAFRAFLGEARHSFETVFLYLADDGEPIHAAGQTTWYDARTDQPNRTAEYRLCFRSSAVSERFRPVDLLIIGLRPNGTLLIIAADGESSIGGQLLWLFGLETPDGPGVISGTPALDRGVDYAARCVLDSIGVDTPPEPEDIVLLNGRFGTELPSARAFSEFAREHTRGCNPMQDPDHALIAWLDTEQRFFRAFERLLVEERLRTGFVDPTGDVDVDGFVSFSLSVQNRRKSRAGHSLENHLEELFAQSSIAFERGAITERRSRPDFLFPDSDSYFDESCPLDRLAVLGAKATCKDRWRQVTAEADRIDTKHLVTLEPGISVHQTKEMKSRNVQLVVPRDLHQTYTADQQRWLWTIADFIGHVRGQQA